MSVTHTEYSDLPEVTPIEVTSSKSPAWETTSTLPETLDVHTTLPQALEPERFPSHFPVDPQFEKEVVYPDLNKNPRKICGLRRRIFFIIVGIAMVVIICIIVAGTVGIVIEKGSSKPVAPSGRNHPPNRTESPSNKASPGYKTLSTASASPVSTHVPQETQNITTIAEYSNISSLFYDDDDLGGTQAVFFQNNDDEIMASFRYDKSAGWQTINISKNLKGKSVHIKKGSSIATCLWHNRNLVLSLRIYAITTEDAVTQLAPMTNFQNDSWTLTPLGTTTAVKVGKASSLAAWQPYVGGSPFYPITLVWQGDDGKLYTTTSAKGWAEPQALSPATKGSGLVLGHTNGESNGTNISFRLYYDSNGDLQEGLMPLGNDPFSLGQDFADTTLLSSKNPAAAAYSISNMLVIDIAEDGGLEVHFLGMEWSGSMSPVFFHSPKGFPEKPKFTAVTVNSVRLIYGIVDGRIYAWSLEADTPTIWTYMSEIETNVSS